MKTFSCALLRAPDELGVRALRLGLVESPHFDINAADQFYARPQAAQNPRNEEPHAPPACKATTIVQYIQVVQSRTRW